MKVFFIVEKTKINENLLNGHITGMFSMSHFRTLKKETETTGFWMERVKIKTYVGKYWIFFLCSLHFFVSWPIDINSFVYVWMEQKNGVFFQWTFSILSFKNKNSTEYQMKRNYNVRANIERILYRIHEWRK